MRYDCFLKIGVPETKHFIEVGCIYHLPVHPNITDNVTIMGFPSKITEIHFDFDEDYAITIYLTAMDGLYGFDGHKDTEEDAIEWLFSVFKELQSYDNNVTLSDYTFDIKSRIERQ